MYSIRHIRLVLEWAWVKDSNLIHFFLAILIMYVVHQPAHRMSRLLRNLREPVKRLHKKLNLRHKRVNMYIKYDIGDVEETCSCIYISYKVLTFFSKFYSNYVVYRKQYR